MAAKTEPETTATKKSVPNTPYLMDPETGETRKDADGRPLINHDYVDEPDTEIKTQDLEFKTLCNITHGSLTLHLVKPIEVPDKINGGMKKVLACTGVTKVYGPGRKVKYPGWPAQHPKTGWVVATPPGPGETHTMWAKAEQIIWYWQNCVTDDIFVEMADLYKKRFNDRRIEIVEYIDKRREEISKYRKLHSTRA